MNHNYDLFTIRAIFLFLNFLLIVVMLIYGQKISKTQSKKNAWHYASVIIVMYSITMGLRFGREIDYNHLFYDYVEIGKSFMYGDYELLFRTLCWTLYNIGAPFSFFIWLCSIVMVFSFLHLCINHYKEYAPLACVIFLWEAHDVELLIRYYLAFSFVLFALSYFKSKRYEKAAIFAAMACTTHIGMIPLLGVVFALSFVKGLIAPPIVIFGLLIISNFVAQVEMLQSLAPYLNILAFNEKSANYVDSYEMIVSGNFSAVGGLEKEFSLRHAIVALVKWGLPIFLSSRLIKENKLNPLEVNLFFIGIIIAPIFLQVQILNRYAEVFTFFSVFVSSAACYYVIRHRKSFNQFVLYYTCLVLVLTIWPAISQLIAREYWWHMLYIWDAGDWDTIPVNYFLSE